MTIKKHSVEDSESTARSIRRKTSAALALSSGLRKITVGAGDEKKSFDVHVGLLAKHSAYFGALLEGEKLSGDKPTAKIDLKLPDEDPALFELLSSFIYSGRICSEKEDAFYAAYDYDPEWDSLADAWLLGSKLESTSFMDAIADALVAKLQQSYPADMLTDLLDGSPQGSPIRQLLADIVTYEWGSHAYSEPFEELDDVDFLR
nr:hypothetical protein B0A51_15765 [Rachicladosporium sp. CCFEE 5018]